ncbi:MULTISPECIES: hypothetical protein [unclassified Fusibacter]|uniref:hypothetical protein n=1 Tax=unclassified Fusibacter TaxID=2624464 RepID=UPI001012B831|nr:MULTISPECIES: hypothetical protein [unclassified Fusibacter]MCK8060972.1 hypothetical protein [Fusibacter sp. A2]NPE20574.1 hypothetical protein [Fusibacter sp. A1]RXV63771.1 hypothetical protein DWB64_01985 [Fusibacter sp. A1]
MIKFYDANGKLMTVPNDVYRAKVLPNNIKQAWNDSNKLYQLILMSLNDEFYSEMIAPAKRLLKIDSFKERSHTIMGIVNLKMKS